MPTAYQPTRRLVCGVSKTGFWSSAVIFCGTIKHVWYYLVSSRTADVWKLPKTGPRTPADENFIVETRLVLSRRLVCGGGGGINEILVMLLQKIFSVLIFVDRFWNRRQYFQNMFSFFLSFLFKLLKLTTCIACYKQYDLLFLFFRCFPAHISRHTG